MKTKLLKKTETYLYEIDGYGFKLTFVDNKFDDCDFEMDSIGKKEFDILAKVSKLIKENETTGIKVKEVKKYYRRNK